MFDSPLTSLGLRQAQALNRVLKRDGGLQRLVPNLRKFRVLTSPLTRTIQTTAAVYKGLPVGIITGLNCLLDEVGKTSSADMDLIAQKDR